jgi:hypothetical protein
MARVAARMSVMPTDPLDAGDWPKTEPLGTIDYNDYTNPTHEVVRPAPLAVPVAVPLPVPLNDRTQTGIMAVPRAAQPRAASPSTIIPVPKLPRVSEGSRLEPVVRAMPTPIPPSAPRRFPKGTGPVEPTRATRTVISPPAPIRVGDETSPGIALPPRAVASKLPSIKQRMASQS